MVSASVGEELIKDLVSKAQIKEAIELPADNELLADNEPPSDNEEELAVTEFKIAGVKYLKSAENTLYNFKTHEEIGTWNPQTKEIEMEDDD